MNAQLRIIWLISVPIECTGIEMEKKKRSMQPKHFGWESQQGSNFGSMHRKSVAKASDKQKLSTAKTEFRYIESELYILLLIFYRSVIWVISINARLLGREKKDTRIQSVCFEFKEKANRTKTASWKHWSSFLAKDCAAMKLEMKRTRDRECVNGNTLLRASLLLTLCPVLLLFDGAFCFGQECTQCVFLFLKIVVCRCMLLQAHRIKSEH